MKEHNYNIELIWTGNLGEGTKSYQSYGRDYTISADGKEQIKASADSGFRGDPDKYNPEELLLAAISSCHMLWYLHICSESNVLVDYYADSPRGILSEYPDGGGRFSSVILKPKVIIHDESKKALAETLHAKAHAKCFISNSLNFPVEIEPAIGSKTSN